MSNLKMGLLALGTLLVAISYVLHLWAYHWK